MSGEGEAQESGESVLCLLCGACLRAPQRSARRWNQAELQGVLGFGGSATEALRRAPSIRQS